MLGLMQNWRLLLPRVLEHAEAVHFDTPVVSAAPDGALARSDWASAATNARRLAKALAARGFNQGDRLATLAFNSARHLECWFAIAGMGAIYHTLNPRLHPDQLAWIAGHAEDGALFFDPHLSGLVAELAPRLPHVRLFVALGRREELPALPLTNLIAYDDLVGEADDAFTWPEFDENTACALCYTSGTTGNPKGVLYSHRSTLLHALTIALPDAFGSSARDAILPMVPMFHANGWCLPYAAAIAGAKLVLPGPRLDGASLVKLIVDERITITASVPSLWLSIMPVLEENGITLRHLKRVFIGGAAAPRALIETLEQKHGVEVRHSWGMTETSPVGTIAGRKAKYDELAYDELLDIKMKQGRPLFGIEMKITDDANRALPHDGKTAGRLKVRGAAVIKSYYRSGEALDPEGWFDTGDIATLDGDANMAITDRAKDVIKSGGEWISSLAIENHAMSHPAVAEAAVIGVPHPKWDERPLLVVVLKPGQGARKQDILEALSGKIAKWWMPDDVVFVDAIPHSATGKIQKIALRQRFAHYILPR